MATVAHIPRWSCSCVQLNVPAGAKGSLRSSPQRVLFCKMQRNVLHSGTVTRPSFSHLHCACESSLQSKKLVRGLCHGNPKRGSPATRLNAQPLEPENVWADKGNSPPSETEQPDQMSPSEHRQDAFRKRMDNARSKAADYQQASSNEHVSNKQAEGQVTADSSLDEFGDESDDDQPTGGGAAYGVMSLLLNQKKKKESFYKNATRAIPKPAVLPDIEIVRGKKVVSERRLKDE